jgi:hypothetical protein
LRGTFGIHVAKIAAAFKLDVEDQRPKNLAAYGIGKSGDTSPRLGCCKVAGGYCGGNLFRVRRLTAKWTGHGYCGSNLRLPLGEPLESTRREAKTGIPARSRAYVSVSRAQFDVRMYTNDAKALGYELSRDVSHPTAIQQEPAAAQKIEPQSVSIEAAQGLSVG